MQFVSLAVFWLPTTAALYYEILNFTPLQVLQLIRTYG